MRTFRSARAAFIATVGTSISLSFLSPASACSLLEECPPRRTTVEPRRSPAFERQWFVTAIDAARKEQALRGLVLDPDLNALAQRHAQRMASRAEVFHNRRGIRARNARTGETIGENVGSGFSHVAIHESFLGSPQHRATLMGPFERLGIGAAWREGELFVVEVFSADGTRISHGPRESTVRKESSGKGAAPVADRDPILVRVEPPVAAPVVAPVAAQRPGGSALGMLLGAALVGAGVVSRLRRRRPV